MFISMSILQDYFCPQSFNLLVVVVVNCFSVLDFRSVSYTYKIPTTVLKIGVEIGEKFSRCLLSAQKLLYKTACSTVLVFFFKKKKTEIFELIGSGFVVVDNFHSQFLV